MRPLLVLALSLLPTLAFAKSKLNTSGTQSRDVIYTAHGIIALPMRIVRPAKIGKTALPVVLYFHGGAWKDGSYQKLSPVLLDLARAGMAVASVEVRSSKEAPFPAQLNDARAAVRWIKENANSYSLDARKIGVYGLSTGGLFAGLLAYSGSSIGAVCLQSAPSDLNSLHSSRFDWNAPDSPLAALMGFAPASHRDALKRASPIFYADEDAPPTLILAGKDDEFIESKQSEALFGALKRAKTPVQFKLFEGENHDLKGVQDEVAQTVVDFFVRELKSNRAHSRP